jgi:DNA-binding transcriptional MocR family regulator
MLIKVDRTNALPLHRQIRDRIAQLIDDGSLRASDKLPPTRVLAQQLGVNRSTVYRAYEELWSQGYLEARRGSYSTVRARLRPAQASSTGHTSVLDWERLSTPGGRQSHSHTQRLTRLTGAPTRDVVDFSKLTADRALCPVDELKAAFRQVINQRGREIFDYGDVEGYAPLRETIARGMRVHGVSVSADEILVTNGSQHGMDLLLRTFAGPGSTVVQEAPSYSMGLALCRQYGVRPFPVAMRDDGMDLDLLERRLRRGGVAFVYTMPNFQNPTGITTSQAHRERLLAMCEEHRVLLVEDGFEEELKYMGHAVLPIKSMDRAGVVAYLGTFSKVIFPGLRVGWIAAHRDCVERLSAVSRVTWLSGNVLAQAAVSRFCDQGSYEEHIRRVHKAYRGRMDTLLRSLKARMPAGVTWSEPTGGYTLLLRVNSTAAEASDEASDEERVLAEMRKAGVLLSPGSLYFSGRPDGLCFRLCIANLTEAQIEEGCRRLGRVLGRVVAKV